MINQIKDTKNSIIEAGVNTSFEQYKDLFATLGLAASYDDLTTTDTASGFIKKTKWRI